MTTLYVLCRSKTLAGTLLANAAGISARHPALRYVREATDLVGAPMEATLLDLGNEGRSGPQSERDVHQARQEAKRRRMRPLALESVKDWISPSDEDIARIVGRLTWNGAYNLMRTITNPHGQFPDLLAGGDRLYTGLGKWTTIAATGVENHLKALGLIAPRMLPWNGIDRGWESLCLTPLGQRVASHVHTHWGTIEFPERKRRV
jgi:hypothetical protein